MKEGKNNLSNEPQKGHQRKKGNRRSGINEDREVGSFQKEGVARGRQDNKGFRGMVDALVEEQMASKKWGMGSNNQKLFFHEVCV